jgi:FkbM family methyltransferase
MLRLLLKRILRIPLFNKPVRNTIISLNGLLLKISGASKISGIVEIIVQNRKFKWFTNADDNIANNIYYNRYDDLQELCLFNMFASHSKVVFDIGANTGIFSIVAASSNINTKIIAFEPILNIYNRLNKNVEINQILNISTENIALSNDNGFIEFFVAQTDTIPTSSSVDLEFNKRMSYKDTSEGVKIEFEKVTCRKENIDTYIERNQIKNLDLLKIDVEKHEMEVFEGARKSFQKFSPIIIVEIMLDDIRKEYFDAYLKSMGYYSYLILQEGIIRLDEGLLKNFDTLSFLFSKKRTSQVYTSFKDTNIDLIQELMC